MASSTTNDMMTTTINVAAVSSASVASVIASASSALAAASSASAEASSALAVATGGTAAAASNHPASYKIVGIILAVVSGLFIGSSFVFKKKGLLSMQNKPGFVAGEGHAYLKSPMWWSGMILMIVGEVCNFVAYAFTEAILVTPLGALSVVICAILSSIFLKEKLTFFGKIGCLLCILGAVIIALNGPQAQTATTIPEFQKLFLAPGFLAYGSVVIVVSLGLIFWVGPRYGKKNMLVYILVCSLIGGLSVVCTSGLGASILTSINGNNQFKNWFIYFLLGFVICTLLTEINYLNKALELFNTAMVTPTYYVIFTFATLVTDVILNQGFHASAVQITTVVFGFFTICCGITLLQMSKIDPHDLAQKVKLDRRSTMLLTTAHKAATTSRRGGGANDEYDHDGMGEKSNLDLEDPGVDSVRGILGVVGSVHRAVSARRSIIQRRKSQMSARSTAYSPYGHPHGSRILAGINEQGESVSDPAHWNATDQQRYQLAGLHREHDGIVRHQLYDAPMALSAPMPSDAMERISQYSGSVNGDHRSKSVQGRDRILSPSNESPVTASSHTLVPNHQQSIPYPAARQNSHDSAAATSARGASHIGFQEEVIEHRYPRVGQEGQALHQSHYPPIYNRRTDSATSEATDVPPLPLPKSPRNAPNADLQAGPQYLSAVHPSSYNEHPSPTSPTGSSIIDAYHNLNAATPRISDLQHGDNNTTPRPDRVARPERDSSRRYNSHQQQAPLPSPSQLDDVVENGQSSDVDDEHGMPSSSTRPTLQNTPSGMKQRSYSQILNDRFGTARNPDLRLGASDTAADGLGLGAVGSSPHRNNRADERSRTNSTPRSPNGQTMRQLFNSITDHLSGHGHHSDGHHGDESEEEHERLVEAGVGGTFSATGDLSTRARESSDSLSSLDSGRSVSGDSGTSSSQREVPRRRM